MRPLLVTFFLLTSGPVLVGQQPSLRELARKHGDTEIHVRACGGSPTTLDTVVGYSTVLVHGVIEQSTSELTADETRIVTRFAVRPFELLHAERRALVSRTDLVMFEAAGGKVLLDGHHVTETVKVNGKRIDLHAGQEVVLLGTHRDGDGQWTFDPYGTFVVEGGFVSPVGVFEGWTSNPHISGFLRTLRDLFAKKLTAGA